MPKVLHKMRSHRFRLLASLLVMLAILCNGIVLAQAHSISSTKECYAEMMNGKMASHSSCSMPNKNCDDQCLARCMSTDGVLLSVPFTISPNIVIAGFLPQPEAAEHPLTHLGPGLRPPIYT